MSLVRAILWHRNRIKIPSISGIKDGPGYKALFNDKLSRVALDDASYTIHTFDVLLSVLMTKRCGR